MQIKKENIAIVDKSILHIVMMTNFYVFTCNKPFNKAVIYEKNGYVTIDFLFKKRKSN